MKNIIFIAPPAAGKGTQCELLVEKYGYNHLSSGELLRSVDKTTELGKEITETINRGDLINDELMFSLIKEELKTWDLSKGVLFDGSIRTLRQIELYDELCEEIGMERGYVIFINISEERAFDRSLGRLGCPNCGKIYHKMTAKPKVEGICDVCQTELTSRDDDTEEGFRNRFQTYLKKVRPVIDYYKERGELNTIEAQDNKYDTFALIEKVINND